MEDKCPVHCSDYIFGKTVFSRPDTWGFLRIGCLGRGTFLEWSFPDSRFSVDIFFFFMWWSHSPGVFVPRWSHSPGVFVSWWSHSPGVFVPGGPIPRGCLCPMAAVVRLIIKNIGFSIITFEQIHKIPTREIFTPGIFHSVNFKFPP